MKRHSSKKGFTLIELLVVVAIIALLIAILIPSLGRAKELANRAACSANLRGMVQTMAIYGNEQNDLFPSVEPSDTNGKAYVVATAAVGQAATSSGDILSIGTNGYYVSGPTGGKQAGNPLACLWVLTLREGVSPKLFLCKSDPVASQAAPTVSTTNTYYDNFSDGTATGLFDPTRDSYSIAYPWTSSASGSVGGWWKNLTLADLPVASDMAPVNAETYQGLKVDTTSKNGAMSVTNPKQYNSHNHGGDGQNVAYGDNHVEFQKSPLCGQQSDNIFDTGANNTSTPTSPVTGNSSIPANPSSSPSGNAQPYDTVMVPVRSVNGATD